MGSYQVIQSPLSGVELRRAWVPHVWCVEHVGDGEIEGERHWGWAHICSGGRKREETHHRLMLSCMWEEGISIISRIIVSSCWGLRCPIWDALPPQSAKVGEGTAMFDVWHQFKREPQFFHPRMFKGWKVVDISVGHLGRDLLPSAQNTWAVTYPNYRNYHEEMVSEQEHAGLRFEGQGGTRHSWVPGGKMRLLWPEIRARGKEGNRLHWMGIMVQSMQEFISHRMRVEV